MASHNNGTKKFSSIPTKSDSSQFSKRKKDLENTKEGSCNVSSRVPYEWSQTEETLQIVLSLDKMCAEELKEADVVVTDVNVHVKLPDGREWACAFPEEVEGKQSRVVVQKNKLCIWLIKKKSKNWSKHHLVDISPKPKKRSAAESSGDPVVTKVDPLPPDRVVELEKGGGEKPENDGTDPNLEMKEKEEEPVYYLQHTKNDWIESSKNDVFTIHVYVKQAPKDTVKIFYSEKTVTVKFQTKDSKFLALHANSTEETVFCWKINLKHEIIPSQCRHKVTPSLIEIILQKKNAFRWGALEAPVNKAPPVSKSDSWLPVTKSSNQTEDKNQTSQSDAAFDELGDVKILEEEFEPAEENGASPVVNNSHSGDKENRTQKPMCKVSPLNKPAHQSELIVSPGMTGLENLGNTCFMNSVLQALANTREFRDYFLEARFQKEINTDNVLGTGGKLAVAFAVLMKVLWAGSHYSYAPSKLKNLIALKASQFTGYAQHDAQEFMAFLLDGLHEDLNRIRKKPYIETKDSDDRPDEVVADEAWAAYKKRNDSFVVDLFQGQYKSKLVCPECGKVSITFDPFLYLSVPLPKKKRLLEVTFMSKEPHKKPLKMILKLPKDATLDQFKDQVFRKTGVKPCDMRIFEAYKGRIHKFLGRNSDLNNIQLTDTIIVAEVLSEEVAGEPVYEVAVIQRTVMPNQLPTKCAECKKPCADGCKLKRCTKCYKVGYCDQTCQKHHWLYHKPHCKNTLESVGRPFLLSIPQSRATFSRICKLMEAFARYSVDVFQPPVKAESPTKLTSQSSNSDLSSSSQSSGSLSSLDSQSSLSSTCTLTAEGESRVLSDPEDGCMEAKCGDSLTNPADTELPGVQGSDGGTKGHRPSSDSGISSEVGAGCEESREGGASSQSRAAFITSEEMTDDSVEMPPPSTPLRLSFPSTSTCSEGSHNKTLPTNAVLGVQVEERERITPPFYVKPVNQSGEGVTGPQGERLDDKGDVPLDLSDKHFLSMDWKNSEKLTPYVLVQTKPLDTDDDPIVRSSSLDENGNITLDQCLHLFTEPEVLAPDEAWYCPQCKDHREATKQMSIWRLPHTLIIQLKRFSFRNFIWRDKIDKMVEFPIRGLDLSPYYIGTRPASEPRPLYDLYAVVNHHGGILGGHYTSYVRCADLVDPSKNEVDWRLCDDSQVNLCSEKNVVTRAAYVLFYRRRNMFVPLPPVVHDVDQEEDDSSLTKGEQPPSQENLALPQQEDSLSDEGIELDPVQVQSADNKYPDSLGFTDMDTVD